MSLNGGIHSRPCHSPLVSSTAALISALQLCLSAKGGGGDIGGDGDSSKSDADNCQKLTNRHESHAVQRRAHSCSDGLVPGVYHLPYVLTHDAPLAATSAVRLVPQ
eukprot:scaffold42954_cov74-Phaeocystis_antarctica.AAC.4